VTICHLNGLGFDVRGWSRLDTPKMLDEPVDQSLGHNSLLVESIEIILHDVRLIERPSVS
jgi:hypothetical protein